MGIMQPYFFPHPAHFSLIAHCDEWVVFDVTQYTPKTWMNRNRVLHPNGGANWISVPLGNGSIAIKTSQANILEPAATAVSVLGKISHYRRKAPFYQAVEALVRSSFALPDGDVSLVHLNVRGLAAVCGYLGVPFRHRICSELQLDLPDGLEPGDWAPEICSRLGADEYLNPIGGQSLFSPSRFEQLGIGLTFLDTDPLDYRQGDYPATAGLSILDALMWYPPEVVRAALTANARLVPA